MGGPCDRGPNLTSPAFLPSRGHHPFSYLLSPTPVINPLPQHPLNTCTYTYTRNSSSHYPLNPILSPSFSFLFHFSAFFFSKSSQTSIVCLLTYYLHDLTSHLLLNPLGPGFCPHLSEKALSKSPTTPGPRTCCVFTLLDTSVPCDAPAHPSFLKYHPLSASVT